MAVVGSPQSSLPSGQYYVRIDGVGRGTATTGYTDYGSIGAYTLNVSGCAGPAAVAPSAPQNLTGSYLGSGQVQLSWAPPANDGGAAITSYTVTASPGGQSANGSGSPIVVSGMR